MSRDIFSVKTKPFKFLFFSGLSNLSTSTKSFAPVPFNFSVKILPIKPAAPVTTIMT